MFELQINVPDNYNFQSVVDSHGWRDLAPFRYENNTVYRTHQLSSGKVINLQISDGLRIAFDADLHEGEQREVTAAVRQMFRVEDDLSAFYDAIRDEPRYTWVEPAGAGRFLRAPTVWEDLVKILFTTNVSWRNTIGMVERITDYGSTASDGTHTFPTATQIASVDPDVLNNQVRSGYRIKSLHRLAQAIASGELEVEAWADTSLDPQKLYSQIIALHGFGAYATGSMMRLLGHHEWLGLDSVARKTYADLHNNGEKASDKEIAAFYEPFGKWRGLALWMDVLNS